MHSYLHKKIYPCKKWVLHHPVLVTSWGYGVDRRYLGKLQSMHEVLQ
jgi:hypothetical protein